MTARTGRGLKRMGLLTLFAVVLLIVTDLTIVQVYRGELKGSFIIAQGMALIAGILLGFFSARKPVPPADPVARNPGESKRASQEDGEQYWRVFENSKDMVYITSADGKVIDINPAGVEMLGYVSKGELLKVHPKDFYSNSPDRKKFMNEVANSGFVRNFETKLKRKDGAPIDVLMTASARKDVSGNTIGYEGFVKDVSDRKRVEEELRKSEERYRTIIESIQDGYFEVDLAGNYTFVNAAECKNMGYAKDELIGMNNRQYTDKENANKVFQAFNRVYRTREPGRGFEWEIVRKDGTKPFDLAKILNVVAETMESRKD